MECNKLIQWMIISKATWYGYDKKKTTCLQRSAFQSSSFTAAQRAPSPVTLCAGNPPQTHTLATH